MAHQRHKAAGRNLQIDILQHQPIATVGKREILDRYRPAAQRGIVLPPRLPRSIHQLEDPLAGHHRLLQHRLLRSQLNQRLVQPTEIADKGVQHPNLNGSRGAEAKEHQQPAQHQRREEAEQRTQQEAVETQRLHARQIVGIAGLAHPLAEPRLLAELLDNAHTVNHFIKAVVDIRQPGAHPPDDRRAVALVDHHDDQHRRENRQRHQRHAPVEAEHRHQHGANQRRAAQHRRHHGNVEIADYLGVVSHPGDKLPDRLRIEFAQRLAQRGIHHVATQLLNDADGGAVKQQRLVVVQRRREDLQADIGHREAANQLQRQRILRHHIVDKVADQQRAADFGGRRNPHHSDRNQQRPAPRRAVGQQAF